MNEQQFLKYFEQFYGSQGMYPNSIPGYTEEQVKAGIHCRGIHFAGDSVDREVIRDMIRILMRKGRIGI